MSAEDTDLVASLREEFEAACDAAYKAAKEDINWWLWPSVPRNPSDRITERLYCGGDDYLYDAREHSALLGLGITHVLDCRSEHRNDAFHGVSRKTIERRKSAFIYRANGCQDDYQPKSVAYFKRSLNFALRALSNPKAKLYVHCAAGINRGPSNAYAILRALGFDELESEGLLRVNRPGVNIAYLKDAEAAVRKLGLHVS